MFFMYKVGGNKKMIKNDYKSVNEVSTLEVCKLYL